MALSVRYLLGRLLAYGHQTRQGGWVRARKIAIIHVGIIGIFLLIDIHQLEFSHTLWYKALKVCRCLNLKHHSTIRLSPVMDSGVRTDPGPVVK